MRLTKTLLAAAACSLAIAPATSFAAEDAASLSLSNASGAERVGATVGEENELAGTGLIIAILAVAAVIAGIIAATDDDDGAVSS